MWKNHILEYVILIIIVLLIFFYSRKKQMLERNGFVEGKDGLIEGNGSIHRRGRGCKEDSVSELLDRITWLSYSYSHTTRWHRFVFPTIIATAIICIASMGISGKQKKLPSPGMIIIMLIGIFISFLAFDMYYHTHGDLHVEYYIRNNASLIRKKMHLEKKDPPKEKCDEIPTRVMLV